MDITKRNGKSGMTLIEILIVVTLIGILAGVMIKSLGGSLEAGKKSAAQLFCDTTARSVVSSYKAMNNGKLPTSFDDLKNAGLITDEAKKDPWNTDYGFFPIPSAADVKFFAVTCGFGAAAREIDGFDAAKALSDEANTAVITAFNDGKKYASVMN